MTDPRFMSIVSGDSSAPPTASSLHGAAVSGRPGPHRFSWDRFARRCSRSRRRGAVETSVEAHADATLDVVVTPPAVLVGRVRSARMDRADGRTPRHLRALFEDRGARRRSGLPPASAHPPAHVAGSWHWLDGPGPVVPPTLWLLSAGDARGATEGFGLAGARTGPAGFASRRPPFGSVWSCSLTCLFYVRPWPSGFWVGGRPFGTR